MPDAEKDVQRLTDALYADADLGPGYMLRDDCEHMARRVLATGIVCVTPPAVPTTTDPEGA